MALPFTYDLVVQQGGAFVRGFRYQRDGKPMDLSGYDVRSQIRRNAGGQLLLDLTPYTVIQPNGVRGRILINVPATETAKLTSNGQWDMFLVNRTDPGDAVRLCAGAVRLERAVSL